MRHAEERVRYQTLAWSAKGSCRSFAVDAGETLWSLSQQGLHCAPASGEEPEGDAGYQVCVNHRWESCPPIWGKRSGQGEML